MKVQSWFSSTCKQKTSTDTNSFISDTTTTTTAKSPNSDTSTSLHSNLSLQTLPSVPSLQRHLSLLETLDNLSVSQLCAASLPPHAALPTTCLAVHEGLLYAASGHYIAVYDHRRSVESRADEFNGRECSSGSIKAVAFCGGLVFTAHQDCRIRVWKVSSENHHRLVTMLPTVNDRLRRFALPGSYVAVRRHRKRLWIEHADAVTGLAVNNGTVYSVSWDKSIKIWRASDLRCVESVNRAHDDAINAIAVSRNGTVYTGSADCRIRVWAREVGQKRHALAATLEKHRSGVNTLALNEDASVLFSGSCDRSILVWEREDSASHMVVSGALRGHRKAVLSLFYASENHLLLSGSADRTVRMWQRGGDGKYLCLAVLEGHARAVRSLAAVAEDGSDQSSGVVTVFSGGLDGETKVWKVLVSKLSK